MNDLDKIYKILTEDIGVSYDFKASSIKYNIQFILEKLGLDESYRMSIESAMLDVKEQLDLAPTGLDVEGNEYFVFSQGAPYKNEVDMINTYIKAYLEEEYFRRTEDLVSTAKTSWSELFKLPPKIGADEIIRDFIDVFTDVSLLNKMYANISLHYILGLLFDKVKIKYGEHSILDARTHFFLSMSSGAGKSKAEPLLEE